MAKRENPPRDRRPDLDRIQAEIKAKNPKWSKDRVTAAAKQLWHERNPSGIRS